MHTGVTFDSNNYLYVVDGAKQRIQKFGVSDNQHNSSEFGSGHLCLPVGIATHNDKVYVTEIGDQRISVFHTNGQFSHIIGKEELGMPYDVTVIANDQLLVAGGGHHCIYTFTLDGNYVGKFSSQGRWLSNPYRFTLTTDWHRGQYSQPVSLTTDICGFILVVDNAHVSIFDKDGNFINCFGSEYIFSSPRGIALAPNGDIYIYIYIYIYIC